jgi:hypothetical protein
MCPPQLVDSVNDKENPYQRNAGRDEGVQRTGAMHELAKDPHAYSDGDQKETRGKHPKWGQRAHYLYISFYASPAVHPR